MITQQKKIGAKTLNMLSHGRLALMISPWKLNT
jgi:hypothetical protein